MSLGERLREAREDKGWTQVYVSKCLGITSQSLSNYERGSRTPDPELLQKFARIYGVSVDWLLEVEGKSSRAHSINPDVRAISRAAERMNPDQVKQLRRVVEAMFPEVFKQK